MRDGLLTPWLSPSQQFQRVNAGTLLTGINESAMLVILAFVDLFFVQSLSHVWLVATPWAAASQASLSFTISSSYSHSCLLSPWCHPTILFSVAPFPPAFNLSQHQGLFWWVGSLHQVAKVLEFQHQSFQWIFRVNCLSGWLVCSPCSPRDSQESSPAPQLESNISSVLSLLYGPTLTSIHDYGKKHSFDYTDLWWQNSVSAF